MRYPLDQIYITGAFKEPAVPGTGLSDTSGIKRHIGVDLRATIGTKVYSPGGGVVTQSTTNPTTGLQIIEIRIGVYLHRFLHLNRRDVFVGNTVSEGQQIGISGNSGNVAAHLHWDVRKNGTTYNASLYNYIDPFSLVQVTPAPQGGSEVATAAQVNNLYKAILHREGDPGGIKNYTGRDANTIVAEMLGSAEFQAHQNFITTAEQTNRNQLEVIRTLTDRPTKDQLLEVLNKYESARGELSIALRELEEARNKPPIEIIKEVPAEVNEKVVVEGFFKRIWSALFNKEK